MPNQEDSVTDAPATPAPSSKKSFPRRRILKLLMVILFFFLVACLTASSVYFYYRYNQEINRNPYSELSQITKRISRFMVLPEEQPTLATVTQKELLAEQGFFQQAENGDRVLIFPVSRRAILYRPSLGKVIDVAAVRSLEPELSDQAEPVPVALVEVYNGTFVGGLAGTVADRLVAEESLGVEVTASKDARIKSYEESIVVDLSGTNQDRAAMIAQLLGGRVGTLPSGEASPAADLLVIVGLQYTRR